MLKDVNDNEYKKYLYGKYLVSFDVKKLKHIHDDKEYSDLNELLHVLDELEKASELSKSEPISAERVEPHFESSTTETAVNDSTTKSQSNSIAELENKVKKHPKVTLFTVSGKTCYRYKGKTYEDPRELLSKLESQSSIFGNIKNYIVTNTDFDDKGLWIGLGVVLSIPIFFFSFLSLNANKKTVEYVDTYQEPILQASSIKSKMLVSTEYFYSNGACEEYLGKVCINLETYEKMCLESQGLNERGARILTQTDSIASHMLKNGSVDNSEVYWDSRLQSCRASVTVSGIFNGSSYRKTVDGKVYGFILNVNNQLLVSFASEY